VKVRDENANFSLEPREGEAQSVNAPAKKQQSIDRHAEMKRRGDEKKKLPGMLKKPSSTVIELDNEDAEIADEPLFTIDSKQASTSSVSASATPISKGGARLPTLDDIPAPKKKKNKKRKSDESPDPKSTKKTISKPSGLSSRHTDHKRQKMREREKEKRNKLREKKQRKLEKSQSKQKPLSQTQRITTTPLEGPSDALKELGMKLSAKLEKERNVYERAYSTISHKV